MKKLAMLMTFFMMIGLSFAAASQASPNIKDFDERQFEELGKFLERYSCSQEVEEDIKAHYDPAAMRNNKVENHSHITEVITPKAAYYLKGTGADRIVLALRLERFLQDQKILDIGVAEKCWSKRLSQVVAKGVVHTDLYLGSLEDSPLDKVKRAIGFQSADDHSGNLFHTKKGIIFIDTETVSFDQRSSSNQNLQSLLYEKKYDDSDLDFSKVMTQLIHLKNKIFFREVPTDIWKNIVKDRMKYDNKVS